MLKYCNFTFVGNTSHDAILKITKQYILPADIFYNFTIGSLSVFGTKNLADEKVYLFEILGLTQ